MWCRGVVVITTAQLHSTKPELRFCTDSNPACGVSDICNGEDLWQRSQLERRLNTFRWLTIPQKQFIIIKLISVPNFSLIWLLISKTESEYHHWILYIWINLGAKFQLKLTILSFWTKFDQKGVSSKKPKNEHPHWILHVQIGQGTKFQLKLTIFNFWTKFAQKAVFGLKQRKWTPTSNSYLT